MSYFDKFVPTVAQFLNEMGITKSLVMFCTDGDLSEFVSLDLDKLEDCLLEYYGDKKSEMPDKIMWSCSGFDSLYSAIADKLVENIEMSTRDALSFLLDIERKVPFNKFKEYCSYHVKDLKARSYDDLFADMYGDIETVKIFLVFDAVFRPYGFIESPLDDADFLDRVFAKLKW